LPSTTPPKRPARSQGPGALLCPSCNGDSFAERSSFKTTSEPLLGAAASDVVVDLMNCTRCGADFPAVRGRRHYALVGQEKLATLLADLEEAKRVNSEMQGLLDSMARRSQSLGAEVEGVKARGDVSVMEARVAALESETEGLAARRDRLAKTLEVVASILPA
jgi:hypothetical protein